MSAAESEASRHAITGLLAKTTLVCPWRRPSDYRLVWLADTHDSFYTGKGARRGGLEPTDGMGYGINPNFDSFVGSEIDLIATYAIKRFASVQAGLGHFFVGDYAKSSLAGIGGTKDATFVYAQLTLNF